MPFLFSLIILQCRQLGFLFGEYAQQGLTLYFVLLGRQLISNMLDVTRATNLSIAPLSWAG
jgi:hypothetical protein